MKLKIGDLVRIKSCYVFPEYRGKLGLFVGKVSMFNGHLKKNLWYYKVCMGDRTIKFIKNDLEVINESKSDAGAKIPKYAKRGDAGMDLYAVSQSFDKHNNYVYGTGLAMEIPEGYVGLLFPRSSISKTAHSLRNAVGVIDSGYRGEIIFKFDINTNNSPVYEVGERIGQIIIMPYPQIEFEEAFELSKSQRGKGGFGSSGTN